MRKLQHKKVVAWNGECSICNVRFTDYSDIVPDHINPLAREEHGETTIRITFRRSTGGAMDRRARAERETMWPAYLFQLFVMISRQRFTDPSGRDSRLTRTARGSFREVVPWTCSQAI
jgi:hypothetical protein